LNVNPSQNHDRWAQSCEKQSQIQELNLLPLNVLTKTDLELEFFYEIHHNTNSMLS
jgi:hypothetical protein